LYATSSVAAGDVVLKPILLFAVSSNKIELPIVVELVNLAM
jgi:hypothetical protein